MRTESSIAVLRRELALLRSRGQRIGFVPTMGFLHQGHLSLVERARAHSDLVVMSIFVNPLQFGPKEDLATYPRDFERDSRLAEEQGVDLLFVPTDGEMYPSTRPQITLVAPELTDRLCGHFRPGHFEGVLTVVAKLFNIVQPDVAVFGQKDYQQSMLIRRMVRDLDMPIDIQVAPIVREPDGLALSSRNVYLDADSRRAALTLNRALGAAADTFRNGERTVAALLAAAYAVLEPETAVRVQYLEIVNPDNLAPVESASAGDVAAIAAFVGRTRLIDNAILS
jgi:pantoate--beta-alanine ligase